MNRLAQAYQRARAEDGHSQTWGSLHHNKGPTPYVVLEQLAKDMGRIPVLFRTPNGLLCPSDAKAYCGQAEVSIVESLKFHTQWEQYTKKELAQATELTLRQVCAYESGDDLPSLERLEMLCSALSVTPMYLVKRPVSLAQRIRQVQGEQGISLTEMGALGQVSQAVVTRITGKERKSWEVPTLEKIAKGLGLIPMMFTNRTGQAFIERADGYANNAIARLHAATGFTRTKLLRWLGLNIYGRMPTDNGHVQQTATIERVAAGLGQTTDYLVHESLGLRLRRLSHETQDSLFRIAQNADITRCLVKTYCRNDAVRFSLRALEQIGRPYGLITVLRESAGISQIDMAQRIGIPARSLLEAEKGLYATTVQALEIICKETGVRPQYLVPKQAL